MTCGRSGIRRGLTVGAGLGAAVAAGGCATRCRATLRRAIYIMSVAAPFALGLTPPALTKATSRRTRSVTGS